MQLIKWQPALGTTIIIVILAFLSATPNATGKPNLETISSLPPAPAKLSFLSKPAYPDYYKIWQLIRKNSLYPERLINWDVWQHKFKDELGCVVDPEQAVNSLINSLNDEYTYFRSRAATQARVQEHQQRNVVDYRRLSGNIAYIHIKTFASKNTASETKAALTQLERARAYILDLRDNKGGYLREAYKVFALLINSGKFVSLKGRLNGNSYYETFTLTKTKCIITVNGLTRVSKREKSLTGARPLMVLVNKETRSVSEILAGALKDNDRAKLLGSKTFGKGIVQNTWMFGNGTSLKIAIARCYLPKSGCINGIGLTPNLITSRSHPEVDQQLLAAMQIFKK